MEEFQFLRDKAFEKIKIADHMLFVTYPMLRDPKLLIVVVDNVFASLDFGMAALLHYERLFKRIPPFKESFPSRLEMFKSMVIPHNNLSPNYVKLITDVRTLLAEHRKSPVSFVKNEKVVICSPSYKVKTVDVELVKRYVFETKLFVKNVNMIVKKNERIFI
jgi:hypothetical protein